jgi:long-chain acyl-CoA synthetase
LREHLATLLDDFRKHEREIAIVRYLGVRRHVTTYGELARLSGCFAALLEDRGVVSGDRVLLWAENSAEWITAFYGCMLRGVIVVPLDVFGSVEFARRVAADVKPKLLVGDAVLLAKFDEDPTMPPAVPTIAFEEWDSVLPAHEAKAVLGLSHDTPLQILFTSGTTGDPKGIVHTHGNVLASVAPIEQAAQKYLKYEWFFHPLRILHTLPLSHVFGQTMGLWIPPIFAAEVHFETRLAAPRILETIKRERISVLAAVPRVMAVLKAHLEVIRPGLAGRAAAANGMKAWKRWWVFRDVHNALGLKFWALISGGGALASPLEQFWNAVGFVVVQGYGMTETTALITLNHPFHVASGTIGKPLPGREVKIGADGEVLVRGPMISTATWSGGELRQRPGEWLATGDLAEEQATGELRFMGRKSETIVTSAGVNIHPEDLEASLEEQPEIAASAVVPIDTLAGLEPCAVLAVRGAFQQVGEAVDRANAKLAEFQRVRRWLVWPEPDLPRTSTGKVRRKTVAEWVSHRHHAPPMISTNGNGKAQKASEDWLYTLISGIAGEHPAGGDDLRLSEDFLLDSLGRVQLSAALKEKFANAPAEKDVDAARTLADLRVLLGTPRIQEFQTRISKLSSVRASEGSIAVAEREDPVAEETPSQAHTAPQATVGMNSEPRQNTFEAEGGPKFIYPNWPWVTAVQWMRSAFLELVAQPLIWFLANPSVVLPASIQTTEPMLIICNHVTAYDGALLEYALPGRIRRHVAAAMLGEMLEDFRRFRNPDTGRFMLFGPIAWFLLTALYNVFPLPRRRDFQRSFAHAGEAMDRGYSVLIFPEGTRSAEGKLARFRPGIGLLVKQAQAPVLPVAITGLGELKLKGRGWFRSGKIQVRVGEPLRFGPLENESAITERLHAEVTRLMQEPSPGRQ